MKTKLKDLFEIQLGIPTNRIKEDSEQVYGFEDFNFDRVNPKGQKVVFDLFHGRSALMAPEHENLVVPVSFATATIPSQINASFIVFWMNESTQAKRQIQNSLEGTLLTRIGANELRDFEINLPNLEYQNAIGQIYSLMLQLEQLSKRKQEIQKKILIQNLNEVIFNG